LAEFTSELNAVLGAIRNGETEVPDHWLDGFYLNSAVLRLAFTAERALKIISGQDRNFKRLINDASHRDTITEAEAADLHELREEVNRIKHDPTDLSERTMRTVDRAEELVEIVEALVAKAGRQG
jgi:hypothetical protein